MLPVCTLKCFCVIFPGFSGGEAAVMNPDPADLLDRLDLSMSSIDMTDTSLAMHEERNSEISGVGKLRRQQHIPSFTHFSQRISTEGRKNELCVHANI